MEGSREIGRSTMRWMDRIYEATQETLEEPNKMAKSRDEWRKLIHDITRSQNVNLMEHDADDIYNIKIEYKIKTSIFGILVMKIC